MSYNPAMIQLASADCLKLFARKQEAPLRTGILVAIELIFNGWGYVFIALAAHKAGQAESAGAGTSATVA